MEFAQRRPLYRLGERPTRLSPLFGKRRSGERSDMAIAEPRSVACPRYESSPGAGRGSA